MTLLELDQSVNKITKMHIETLLNKAITAVGLRTECHHKTVYNYLLIAALNKER